MCVYLYKRWRRSRTTPDETSLRPSCEHRDEPSPEPCVECKAADKAATRYRLKLIAGLFFPFALAALDATIIASALPWIAQDFGQYSQLNWIVSAFNLTSAAFIPCWAQIADVFGRKTGLNAAVITMLIGSTLCTAAPTDAFPVLLLGRAFQGIASAGINVLCRTILADKVSLKENAKNWAVFSLVGGTSYALGPLIGGYFTQSDYRWCFAINLPVGVVALALIWVFLRNELLGPQPIPELDNPFATGRRTRFLARLKVIDYGGQMLFIFGFGLIILGLTWGGVTYSWRSAAVIAAITIGGILVGCFVFWESLFATGRFAARTMPWQKPMIPWTLSSNRDIGLLFFMECVSGMSMFAVLYFCNIYFTAVKNFTSDKAGVSLMFFTPGLAAGTIGCALMTGVWPRTTFTPIMAGTILEAVGMGLMAWACWTENIANVYGFMAVIGCGFGLRFMAVPLHGIGLFRQFRASILALMALSVPLGGTLGLTIMATVFNNVSGLDSHKLNSHGKSTADSSIADLSDDVTYNAKMGVVWAFVAMVPFTLLALVAACCIGNIKLGQGTGDAETGGDNIVIEDVYLLTLFRGSKGIDAEWQASVNEDAEETRPEKQVTTSAKRQT
ncbi:hypothetical protein NLU13_6261 [Sarocladium strictum]|uniref:Major facilitator superfamily (MFS) profile domain-containing protein n=1 Tax=Sarocladium strictum TaxID=5046 RepID=A0AA39GH50_SARSR|nr:hypothetical protein NLU13_6261 [Sarocladium strictum]